MLISQRIAAAIIVLSITLMAACGGSSSGSSQSNNNNSNVDNTDVAYQLSTASIEAVNTQLAFNAFYSSLLAAVSSSPSGASSAPVSVTVCGGTATSDAAPTDTSGTVVFDNYCVSGIAGYGFDSVTLNGSVDFSANTTTNILGISFSGLQVSTDVKTISLNASISLNMNTLAVSVEFSSDGQTYAIEGLTLSSDGSGISITSGTLVSPDYGDITISTTSPLVFDGCSSANTIDDKYPSSGTLVMQNADGERADVTFNSCTDIVICYNQSTVMCDTVTRTVM